MSAWGRFKHWLASAGNVWTLKDPRYWPHLSGARQTVSHEYVSEMTALNYSAVWCATRLMCGTASSLPFPVYRGRDDETREKQRAHPVHRVLNGMFNPEQTATAARSLLWQWQVNWGNGFAEIEREGDDPGGELVAVWPLHPARVKIMRDDSDALYYEVKDDKGMKEAELEPWQMFHVPSIMTLDGINGMGVIEHARETIGYGLAREKYAANFYGSGGVPLIVVEHPGKMDDAQRAGFRKEWHDLHDGAQRENVALLGQGATAKSLSLKAADQQFIESEHFGIEEIARWYGIPPHMLQHLLRATFDNIEQLGIEFVQYSLIPWLRVWEQVVWQKLLTEREREEYFAEHNVDALLRGDSAARAEFYVKMVANGLMRRNEVRKLENLDPVPGGDVFLVQGAMVPLDEDGKPESEFAGTAGQPTTEPVPSGPQALESVRVTANRLLKSRLQWALTKETKEAAKQAKQTDGFCKRIEAFYGSQAVSVASEIGDTVALFGDCGIDVDANAIVSRWTASGKDLLVKAATGGGELSSSIGFLLQSERWQSRPDRIIQEIAA